MRLREPLSGISPGGTAEGCGGRNHRLEAAKVEFPRPCPPPVASLLFEFTVPSLLPNLERSSRESMQAWYFHCMCAEKKPTVLPEDCGSEDREQRKVLTQSNNGMNGNIDLRSVIVCNAFLLGTRHQGGSIVTGAQSSRFMSHWPTWEVSGLPPPPPLYLEALSFFCSHLISIAYLSCNIYLL